VKGEWRKPENQTSPEHFPVHFTDISQPLGADNMPLVIIWDSGMEQAGGWADLFWA